ncbi:MAG TPA: class I SAM-dependent methyltransferase [Microlunatus sp.]
MDEYLALNRAMWDERAPAHAASPDYGVERYVCDPDHLSDVVTFDRPRLGDLTGLRGAHLQCHIGTDTLSLARLGATMTGLDFSTASIEQARALASATGTAIDYHVADVYDAVEVLGAESYDVVYTGIGVLCWLPDVARWAKVVAGLLKPGGRFFIREGHPVLWASDLDRMDGSLVIDFPYFERTEPTIWDEPGTYVSTETEFAHTRSAEWNHGIGEILSAVLDAGLTITGFEEHRSVPWQAMPDMVAGDDGEFRLPERPDRMPLTYTLQAVRTA